MFFVPTGAGDIVAIMIGNILGREITDLVKAGTEVLMLIEVANPHGPWINPFWVYVTAFTFFSITAVILGYFTFVMVKRLYRNRQLHLQQVGNDLHAIVLLLSFIFCILYFHDLHTQHIIYICMIITKLRSFTSIP